MLAYSGGLRISEVVNLELADVRQPPHGHPPEGREGEARPRGDAQRSVPRRVAGILPALPAEAVGL